MVRDVLSDVVVSLSGCLSEIGDRIMDYTHELRVDDIERVHQKWQNVYAEECYCNNEQSKISLGG